MLLSTTQQTSAFDWNLLLALIAVAISISIPAITNFQNNRHQIKLKKIELLFEEKRTVYLEFAEAFGNITLEENADGYFRFKTAMNKCILLCHDKEFEKNAKSCLSYSREGLGAENERFFDICVSCLQKDLAKEQNLLK